MFLNVDVKNGVIALIICYYLLLTRTGNQLSMSSADNENFCSAAMSFCI